MGSTAGHLLGPTSDPAELRAALDGEAQKTLGRHCETIVGAIRLDETVRAIVSSVSGKPGLLAVADHQMLFVFKPGWPRAYPGGQERPR